MTWEIAAVIIAAVVPLTAAIMRLAPSRTGTAANCVAACEMRRSGDFAKLQAEVCHLRKSHDELKGLVEALRTQLVEWMTKQAN